MRVLVLNCGSATLKFQLIDTAPEERFGSDRKLARGLIDGLGERSRCRFEVIGGRTEEKTLALPDLGAAVDATLSWLSAIANLPQPDAVGHRVVHGGATYRRATLVDEAALTELEKLCEIAPLHNPAAVNAIHAARRAFGDAVPMVAVFDTAFHSEIPDEAATYAIPWDLSEKHGIRRYGFHGLAYQYDLARYAELTGKEPERVKAVAFHLGNGCSAAAIRDGRSIDTSMGFTPLEGLVMGTRSGDLDPALLTYLVRTESADAMEVETWLNKRSGLLGISGISNDMRKLLAARETEPRAKLAVDVFCHRARKYLGAYLATLGGADVVVFSGGIGENAWPVRSQICHSMEWCGIHLDPRLNQTLSDEDRCVSAVGSAPQVWIIHADEEAVIARETARALRR